MMVAQLVLIGSLLLAAGPADPEALVQQLGSPRYADRQSAAQALQALGQPALSALRAARDSSDAEIRARAGEILARIEAELLVRPTSVRLDFDDAPLPAVVAALSERTGVALALVPENDAFWQSRRVTLQESGPVTFWQALDRLARAGQLRYLIAQGGAVPGRSAAVQLFAGGEPPELLVSESGPFRVEVQGIHYQRDRRFGNSGAGGAFPRAAPLGEAAVADGAAATERFYLELQVMAEPRMVISQNGAPTLFEAIDDRGRSLLPPQENPSGETAVRISGYAGVGAQMAAFGLQANLNYPGDPATTIKRLRGKVPVIVAARKDDPLVIPLDGAAGKSFQTEEVTLTIHDVRQDANQPQSQIELSVRPNTPADPGMGGAGLMAFRATNSTQSQIEILDAQGRAYPRWYPSASRVGPDEARMTLMLLNDGQVGPPAQLRYYDMLRVESQVEFEFHDIPMP